MRVSVVRPHELSEDQLAVWRRFQDSDPLLASPFLRPEFTQLVAAVRQDVMVAVAEDGGALRGFLPFQASGRVGLPVGGGLSDCQALIAAPGWNFAPRALIRATGLAGYEFTQIRACQRPFAAFHRTIADSYIIELTDGGFDTYARERRAAGHNVVTRTLSEARRLARQLGPLRFVLYDRDPRSLRQLIEWKRQQYRQDRWGGALDMFAYRWTVDLLERVHAAQAEGFAGILSTLWAGDTMVAAHLGMRSSTVLHHWFPAYDSAHIRLAPGRIHLLELIRAAAAAGLDAIELGTGDYGYKQRFANAVIPVSAGFVGASSLALWGRRLWHVAEVLARRVPIAHGRHADELLFRMQWERNHK